MQIYDLIHSDHEKVKALLTELIRIPEGSELQKDLVDQIRDELIPHSRAEEAILYNSLRELDSCRDLVRHSYKEHMEAETLLRTMQARTHMDMDTHLLAVRLREALAHHIHQEEAIIFAAAKVALTAQEAEMMGRAFEELKPKVRSEGLLKTTFDLIRNLMPPRFSKSLWGEQQENQKSA